MVLENPYACLNTKWKAKSRRWTTSSNLNNVNFMLCNAHNVEDKKFTLTEEIFFVMYFWVTSLKKAMLSRIFLSPKCTFHTVVFRIQRSSAGGESGWLVAACFRKNEWEVISYLFVGQPAKSLLWNGTLLSQQQRQKSLEVLHRSKSFFIF